MRKMILMFSMIYLCSIHHSLLATNYYVSALVSSNNTGLSQSFTWNLQKVNDYCTNFKAGDSILFKRGDTFRESLKIQNSNATKLNRIVFAAYGTGNKPIIKGSDQITNWKSLANNIWVADYSKNAQHLFRNNKIITVARFPNNDGLNYTSSRGTIAGFSDVLLNKPAGYFNGATVHIHSIDWQWEKRVVASSEANGTINFNTSCQYAAAKGWGYYFDNKYEFLDIENEWFCDTTANKIYLMSIADPNLSLIESPSEKYTVELSWGNSNVVINNLDIRHAKNINLYCNVVYLSCYYKGLKFWL